MAQSFERHQWKDRLVLLFAPTENNITLQNQISLFKKRSSALQDRRLLIYTITSSGINKDGKKVSLNNTITDLQEEFNIDQNEFTFLLIGLDGGEKLRQTKIVSAKELFAIIDRMPMRRSEIRRKKKG